MIITKNKILDYLKTSAIQVEIIKQNSLSENYELASLKNIISSGLYYLEKEFIDNQSRIKDSLIITNANKNQLSLIEGNVFILVKNPQVLFYKLCRLVMPEKRKGIHSTAIVDPKAKIGEGCYIGPYAVIGKTTIEENCQIDAHVIIGDNVVVEKNTTIEPNSYIGANGVAWIWGDDGKRVIQPQFGGVLIGENCFIGSDVSIVRGSVNENTSIGSGTLIAHGTKIGHGSQLAENCHLANNVSLAGNSKVGARTFLGAACVLSSHASVAEDSVVGAGAVVTKAFSEPWVLLAGVPAKIIKKIDSEQKYNGVPQQKKK